MRDEKELKVMHEYTEAGRKSGKLYSGIVYRWYFHAYTDMLI